MILFHSENVKYICILYSNTAILFTRENAYSRKIDNKKYFVKDNEMVLAVFYKNGEMELFSISENKIEEYEKIADLWIISKEDLINHIRSFAPYSDFNIRKNVKEFYVYDMDNVLLSRNFLC